MNRRSDQYAADHVRRRKHESRQFVVATDVLHKTGLLRTLYGDETLTRRIAQMLNEPALFQLADPVMGCTATVMYEGDTHGWHFDLNDFVVSILLQAPEAGGTFDFAPNIRDDGDENYAGRRRRPRRPLASGALDQSRGGNVAAVLRPPRPAPRAAGVAARFHVSLRFSATTEIRVCATAATCMRRVVGPQAVFEQ